MTRGLADLLAHRGDQVVDDVGRGPVARQAGAAEQEVLQHLLAELECSTSGCHCTP